MSDGVSPQGQGGPGDATPPVDPAYASPGPTYPGAYQQPAYAPPPVPTYPPQPGYPPPPAYPAQTYPAQTYPPPYPQAPQQVYGYGNPPGYPPGYPPQRGPSAAFAIATGVLGILVGLYQTWQAATYLFVLSFATGPSDDYYASDFGDLGGVIVGMAVASGLSALLMFAGSIMLLMRKKAGRWIVVAGCVLTLIVTFVPVALASVFLSGVTEVTGADAFGDLGATLLFMVIFWALFPVLTLVFALLPATRRYCDYRPPRRP